MLMQVSQASQLSVAGWSRNASVALQVGLGMPVERCSMDWECQCERCRLDWECQLERDMLDWECQSSSDMTEGI